MDVLWREKRLTADDIYENVAKEAGWSSATVKTLINRLLKKGALGAERSGRRAVYYPKLSRDAYLGAESESFLDRLFGGRVAPLVSYFSESGKLSDDEAKEIRRILARIESKEGEQ